MNYICNDDFSQAMIIPYEPETYAKHLFISLYIIIYIKQMAVKHNNIAEYSECINFRLAHIKMCWKKILFYKRRQ